MQAIKASTNIARNKIEKTEKTSFLKSNNLGNVIFSLLAILEMKDFCKLFTFLCLVFI